MSKNNTDNTTAANTNNNQEEEQQQLHKKNNTKKIVALQTAWSFAAKGAAFLGFYAANLSIAAYLLPNGFGLWSWLWSWITVALCLSYGGINLATQHFIAGLNAKTQTEQLKNTLLASLQIRLKFSAVSTVLLLLIMWGLGFLNYKNSQYDWQQLAAPAAVILFFGGVLEWAKNILAALHKLFGVFIITSIEFGAKWALAWWALNNTPPDTYLVALLWAFAIAVGLAAITSVFFWLRMCFFTNHLPQKRNTNDTRNEFKALEKKLHNYSLPLFIISVGFLLFTEADIILLGFFHPPDIVGQYNAAKLLLMPLPQISQALAMGSLPLFGSINAAQPKWWLKKVFLRLCLINAFLFGFITVIVWLFAPFIMSYLYPLSNIGQGVWVLRILVLYVLAASFAVVLNGILDYRGKATQRSYNMLASLALLALFGTLGAWYWQGIGVALAVVLAYIPYVLRNYWLVKTELN
ncbi:MAG: oligosaccharide flippase family protein [Sphingobacteriales bacterium]|jgi:O-antigen/teichoic acid export membrane protein|nr:oligosaccharide flippase family protein [Sphingobacteriales bacterium]MBP9140411.1 oligosaccharide flippase family protein [Chitinophagales bacterium]MDA0197324.1 oligosaccharide flippase family protein [Bacteroidota bacterium]MBK6890099.1 oligosaccharide flippase family protein [Sphingobacteriales bacterium]MBK7527374.1 oligosaccharide flippase family protein [Sphingobacteriales bacterium]